jgi:molecular chaperone GrpE (heat shock protein)
MPKITATIGQKKYDALAAQAAAYNLLYASDPTFVALTVDQWVERFIVLEQANYFQQQQDEYRKQNLRARYEAADAATQAQIDALLPVVP